MSCYPISTLIVTRNRPNNLAVTLQSILKQSCHPKELILVDGSEGTETQYILESLDFASLSIDVKYEKAIELGAASQRNQGISIASLPFIWFLDDDVILESFCLEMLWKAFEGRPDVGGVNAMIINQKYTTPGTATLMMYFLMHGERLQTYAGKCIGPAWNLLPEDSESLPEVVEVEWLNTTCTLYRREALPAPVFDDHFTGYSLMEDLTLSLRVGKNWTLLNARTARIFHDSQPGSHKNNIAELAKMELVNRHYVMTKVLHRTSMTNVMKLFIFELFGLVTSMTTIKGVKQAPQVIAGKARGIFYLMKAA